MKICVDCKWHYGMGHLHICGHPSVLTDADPVTGSRHGVWCEKVRARPAGNESACSAEHAELWEAKK